MGWYEDTVGHWSIRLPVTAVRASFQFVYNTTQHFYQQIRAVPAAIHALRTDRRANRAMHQMAYIASHDLLPLILLNAGYAYLGSYLSNLTANANADRNTQFLISTLTVMSECALGLMNFRIGARMTTRMMLLSLKAGEDFNKIQPRALSSTCEQNHCGFIDKAIGNGREWLEFTVNDMALGMLGSVPAMSGVASALSLYARGRYIAKATMPERCPNHRDLQTEYALALGLGFEGMRYLLHLAMDKSSGLPPAFCLRIIDQMALLLFLSLAVQLKPPYTPPEKQTLLFDPMESFESAIGWTSNVLVSGLRVQIPILLRRPGQAIDWQSVMHSAKRVYFHPLTERGRRLILPQLLHSARDFTADPVIGQNWPGVQQALDNSLTLVIQFKYEKRVYYKLAKWFPQSTAYALNMAFGVPAGASAMAIHIFGDDKTRAHLIWLRDWIRSLSPDTALKPLVENNLPPLRKIGDFEDGEILTETLYETETVREGSDSDEVIFEVNDVNELEPAYDSDNAFFSPVSREVSGVGIDSDDEVFSCNELGSGSNSH